MSGDYQDIEDHPLFNFPDRTESEACEYSDCFAAYAKRQGLIEEIREIKMMPNHSISDKFTARSLLRVREVEVNAIDAELDHGQLGIDIFKYINNLKPNELSISIEYDKGNARPVNIWCAMTARWAGGEEYHYLERSASVDDMGLLTKKTRKPKAALRMLIALCECEEPKVRSVKRAIGQLRNALSFTGIEDELFDCPLKGFRPYFDLRNKK